MKKRYIALLTAMVLVVSILAYSALSAEITFTDVPSDAWEAPYVYDLVDRGILSGYGDGTFGAPDHRRTL